MVVPVKFNNVNPSTPLLFIRKTLKKKKKLCSLKAITTKWSGRFHPAGQGVYPELSTRIFLVALARSGFLIFRVLRSL
jgi:hypothetical protein